MHMMADTTYIFLLTPLREGRQKQPWSWKKIPDFYSRPCGRGDGS